MTRHTSLRGKRQGFTLIEILVVLGIVAIVSSITLGGFKEMRNGNKRVSCQTNLVQIYQASRLYAADEGGKFPYYSNPCTSTPTSRDQVGTGLWKLYTFPTKPEAEADADPSKPPIYNVENNAPIERYIRSSKVLHCPNHIENGSLLGTGTSVIDQEFLSYQTCDDGVPTYSTNRTSKVDNSDGPWRRQLLHYDDTTFVDRQPAADTVVTWCQFHRGERDMDNVLFYDGSVQLLPRLQNTETLQACLVESATCVRGWKRTPKAPQ